MLRGRPPAERPTLLSEVTSFSGVTGTRAKSRRALAVAACVLTSALSAPGLLPALALVTIAAATVETAAAGSSTYRSHEAALQQGLEAIKAGRLEAALPALEHAATGPGRTGLLGRFYAARVFSDNNHPGTDHAKAYMLYQRIADELADIDPDDDQRAPFVSKSLMALASYLRNGVEEIGLKPNIQRASQYMHHAATVFQDEDAQFELAKLFLQGDGVAPDPRRAIHWFSVLSQRGHAGAQAFLADLYWRGKLVPRDPRRALALITIAVENAPVSERIWIEDIYQNIFCATSEGTRNEASGVVADWRHKYARSNEDSTLALGLRVMSPEPKRTCSDGRSVGVVRARREPEPDPRSVPMMTGSTLGAILGVSEQVAPQRGQ